MFVHPHLDLDDTLVHYLIGGAGLGIGSLIKVGFDKFAERFWDKEWKEFRVWKRQQLKTEEVTYGKNTAS